MGPLTAACVTARLAVQSGGTVPLPDAGSIVVQTLQALAYAHALNLVHRDVKPPNILVTGRPGAYVARLSDFGLMRNTDEAGLSGITRKGEALLSEKVEAWQSFSHAVDSILSAMVGVRG